VLRLPFQIIEHPELHALLRLAAQASPSILDFPSARTIQRRLHETISDAQQALLSKLPPNAKLSIALDCWTSPFQQAFMAITGYFIDSDWNYREILLSFEPLHGTHSGANLSTVLLNTLQRYQVVDRVLAVTTDNASNNKTLMKSVHEAVSSLELDEQYKIIRIPCLAHVIQLSLKKLLGEIKVNPGNDDVERDWSEDRTKALRVNQCSKEIIDTLKRVRYFFIIIAFHCAYCFSRFVALLFRSIAVPSAERTSSTFRQNNQN
jgi:hypothetical protein